MIPGDGRRKERGIKMNSADIKKALKKEGFGAREVSVKTTNSGFRVTIRNLAANFQKIAEIANAAESISRCEITGDILSGGNTFVRVMFSDDALRPWRAQISAAMKNDEARFSNGGLLYKDDEGFFWFMMPGRESLRCWGLDNMADRIAEEIGTFDTAAA